jgi:uncharacterized protein DUF4136
MNRFTGWAGIAVLTITTIGCAAMTVSSHVERGLDLTRYHTFEWGPPDALPQGDPRLDRNPFFKDHFEGAVEKQLAARGLRLSATSPDLLIHYHATISHRLEFDRVTSAEYCPTLDCEPPVVGFEAGTVILDVLDAATNRLIWRGWAQHAIGDELENPDHMARRIDQAVAGMLARFRPL